MPFDADGTGPGSGPSRQRFRGLAGGWLDRAHAHLRQL